MGIGQYIRCWDDSYRCPNNMGGGMEMVRIYPTNIETTFNISGVDLIGENKIGAS